MTYAESSAHQNIYNFVVDIPYGISFIIED